MRVQLSILLGVLLLGLVLVGCGDSKADIQRKESVNTRAQTFARAESRFPVPYTENFPLRSVLVEMTKRQDMINHPWYIYILGDNGNVIGYYVGTTVPINACDFLSSTQDVDYDSDGGNVVLTSPSLDGIFYGGSGSASGCDAWVFLDQATGALIQIRGVHFYSADQPLLLNAEPITVQTTP